MIIKIKVKPHWKNNEEKITSLETKENLNGWDHGYFCSNVLWSSLCFTPRTVLDALHNNLSKSHFILWGVHYTHFISEETEAKRS